MVQSGKAVIQEGYLILTKTEQTTCFELPPAFEFV
jgi:hypothetical protein